MEANQNAVQITRADLQKQAESADPALLSASWQIAAAVSKTDPSRHSRSMRRQADTVSIRRLIDAVDTADDLPSDAQLHTVRAIRNALRIGRHVAYDYRDRANVPESSMGLTDTLRTEALEKNNTAAAIMNFVFAQYLLWDMQALVADNSFLGTVDISIDEINTERPMQALACATYYLGKHIERNVKGDDAQLAATVYRYAEKLRDETVARISSMRHFDPFTQNAYLLEDTDFSINGFETVDFGATTSVEFNRVEMADIVGNADAKHFAKRLVMRILCYNVLAQKNVFSELGGLVPVWMGYGKPGTGKSMLIAAVATMLQDYCDRLGIPFLFNPLPDNIVDSYQGNTAKNMVAWMKAAQDPTRIVFMPVDDAENILEERTRKGVSEGVRAAIGIFLRYTEGAYAVNRGNATIGVFTNLPEQIDAAVRSRIQGRMVIDGADTVEDFLDQDYIWFRKFADQEGFNNLSGPEAYEYMTAQRELKTMADAGQTRDEPEHVTVAEIFAAAREEYEIQQHEFFANLYMKFMDRFKTFSSRDVRNIQSAVNQRIMDFDLPEEWFETPEAFTQKTYDEQKSMVIELRNANMNGLSLAEIYLQEAVRYLDNYATIADGQFDRDVEAQLEQVRVSQAVQKRAAA